MPARAPAPVPVMRLCRSDAHGGSVGGWCLSGFMLGNAVVEEMSEDAVLDTATAYARAVQQGEVGLLRAAYRWAVLHDPDRPGVSNPEVAVLPGREKARQYGGEGTRPVSEFAAARSSAPGLDVRPSPPQR